MQQITLNFSADALRKVLQRFYNSIMLGEYQLKNTNIIDLMKSQVQFTADEMRVRIGKDLVVNILD